MIDLHMLGTPAFLVDVGGSGFRFADMNDLGAGLSGGALGAIVGRTPHDVLADRAAAERLMLQLAECATRGEAVEFQDEFSGPTGTRTWLITLSPIFASGARDVVQILGIAADITERQRAALQAEREARDANARLRDAIEMLPEAIVFLDADNRYVMWNRRYAELYPGTADLLAPGVAFTDILEASIARQTTPEVIEAPEAWIARRLEQLRNPGPAREERFRDGRWIRYDDRRTSDGGTISVRVDITDLKLREETFRLAFQNNPMPMWIYDLGTLEFIDVNETMTAAYGYSREQLLGMTLEHIRPPEQFERIRAFVAERLDEGPLTGIRHHLKADGSAMDVEVFARKLQYQGRSAVLAAAIDVTQRLKAEARIAHLAHHDPLTGLANRTAFFQRLDAEFRHRSAAGREGSVLYLDLDHFKDVNDRFGHEQGDHLLGLVAERLTGLLGSEDLAARLGGDEFAILRMSGTGLDDAGHLATRIISTLGRPFALADAEVVIGASVGIAPLTGDAESASEVLRRADTALYLGKTDGRGLVRIFEPHMDEVSQARRSAVRELREAVAQDAFFIEYQPLIDLATRRIVACEALLRWNHPVRGMIPPIEFIPVAEETGLIVELGARVLLRACMEATSWPDDVRVAVNLSSIQFRAGSVIGAVVTALDVSGLRPDRLEVEITESLLLADDEPNRAVLFQLRALGVRIALDDFGMGYSSLGYLRSFPIDKIKIDRSFTQELGVNQQGHAIIKAVLALGQALNMTTTAEGVETLEQCDMLRGLGCSEAQGYLFSRPLSASANRTLLATFGSAETIPARAASAA